MSRESENPCFKQPDSELAPVKPSFLNVLAIFRALDGAVIAVSLWLTCLLFSASFSDHSLLVIAALIVYGLFAERCGLYCSSLVFSGGSMMIAWVATSLLILPIILLIRHEFPIAFLSIWLLLTPCLFICSRSLYRVLFKLSNRHRQSKSRFAILGVSPVSDKLALALQNNNALWCEYEFVGFFSHSDDQKTDIQNQPTYSLDVLYEKAKKSEVDIVYIVLPAHQQPRVKEVLVNLSDSTVSTFIVPDIYNFDLLHSRLTTIKGIPALSIYDSPLTYHGFAKRCLDLCISLLLLIVLALPMCVIALCVKIGSKGPVFFKQTRYGFGGEEIKVWKYRSMTVCEDGDVIVQANQADPRVTRVGAFLRKTSLDELPQLFNVIAGTMSLVGPRPHAVAHNEYYRGQIQGYMLRHKVKPGITGLAQIKGFRGETPALSDMEGRVFYDLEYIQRWSHGLDLKILFMTFSKGFVGSKAY